MNQTLTIVGASARAAAQSAARSGFFVHAGDLFADEDLRRIAHCSHVQEYPRGLAEVLQGPQPGGWIYTGALENYPRLIAAWSRVRPLLGNSARVLRHVRNPVRAARALASEGIAVPAVALHSGDVPHDGSWLTKPLRSAGGAHIVPWRGDASQLTARSGRRYFQQFIAGTPLAAVYLAAGRRSRILGISEQLIGTEWTGAGGFRYCGSIAAGELPAEVTLQFAEIGTALAAHFDLRGLFGVDVVLNDCGVWPVEVNPRYTASAEVIERASGVPMVAAHCRACLTGELPDEALRPHGPIVGKAIAFAPEPLVFPGSEQLPAELRSFDGEWPALADYPPPGTAIEAGWPVATVFAAAASRQRVLEALQRRCAMLLTSGRPSVD